jgi:putative membrane protein
MNKTFLTLLLAAAGSATFAAGPSNLDKADRDFIEKAAAGGMLEVAWGKLAETKSENADVKSYATTLQKDHGAANEELTTLAQKKGVVLPTTLPAKEQKELDKLSKAKHFDEDFTEENVKDHKKDVKDFESAAKSAKDPDVKAFAAKTLPTLQAHLQRAEQLHKAVKSGKG